MTYKPRTIISLMAIASCAVSLLCAQDSILSGTTSPNRVDEASVGNLAGDDFFSPVGRRASQNNRPSRAQQLARRDQELTRGTRVLLSGYSKSSDDKKKQITADKIKLSLTEHFEVKREIREAQLVELEVRVKRLRELHDRRISAKSTIIEKRFNHLIDEAEGVGWSVSPGKRTDFINPFVPADDDLILP